MSATELASTTAVAGALPIHWSMADLQQHLGGIPAERVRLHPQPGTATEADVLHLADHENRLFELVDGILVEKTMGWYESVLASLIGTELNLYLRQHDLGKALGPDGTLKIMPDLVRIPDASFVSWARLGKRRPRRPIPRLAPDLAVEVLSESNTPAEMDRKLAEYLQAGVRLVWFIDPETRTAKAFRANRDVVEIQPEGRLDGEDVLPGFTLSLHDLFAEADREPPE